METGQLDRASALAVEMVEDAARHGFNQWRLRGTIQQAVADALATAAGPSPAADDRIAEITGLVDELRAADLNVYLTFFEGALARLKITAGHRDSDRLNAALVMAAETGMSFYDAELLRLRSHLQTDPAARLADLESALRLARHQGALLFELRGALDLFEFDQQAARPVLADAVSRAPADSSLAESARAANALAALGAQ